MTGVLLPLAATAAAGGIAFWCCIRPMRRGFRCTPGSGGRDAIQTADIETQLAAAHAELAQLSRATESARDVDRNIGTGIGITAPRQTRIEQQLAAARNELQRPRATTERGEASALSKLGRAKAESDLHPSPGASL